MKRFSFFARSLSFIRSTIVYTMERCVFFLHSRFYSMMLCTRLPENWAAVPRQKYIKPMMMMMVMMRWYTPRAIVCVRMGECTVYFHLMYYRFDWQISLGYWSTRLSIEHKIVVCINWRREKKSMRAKIRMCMCVCMYEYAESSLFHIFFLSSHIFFISFFLSVRVHFVHCSVQLNDSIKRK